MPAAVGGGCSSATGVARRANSPAAAPHALASARPGQCGAVQRSVRDADRTVSPDPRLCSQARDRVDCAPSPALVFAKSERSVARSSSTYGQVRQPKIVSELRMLVGTNPRRGARRDRRSGRAPAGLARALPLPRCARSGSQQQPRPGAASAIRQATRSVGSIAATQAIRPPSRWTGSRTPRRNASAHARALRAPLRHTNTVAP